MAKAQLPPKPRPIYATFKQVVKHAHAVLAEHGTEASFADLVDGVKCKLARWDLRCQDPRQITNALAVAKFQRARGL